MTRLVSMARRAARFLSRHNCDSRAERDREGGFTLVEMLVVITIIGIVMALVGPRVLGYLSDSKVKAAKIQIQSFSAALDLYYLDNGAYPSASEGLAALVQRPGAALAWNGPYLRTGSVPNDPWGHAYLYKVPGDHAPYEIDSQGPNGTNDPQNMIRSASR